MEPFNHATFVFRGAWNGVQIGEPVPQIKWFQLAYGVVGMVLHAPKVGPESCVNAPESVEKLS